MSQQHLTPTQPAIATKFWNGLQATAKRATCPDCHVAGCEVRQARNGRRVETYVNHCRGPRRVHLGKSQLSQVMNQLAKDESGDSSVGGRPC